MYVPNAWWSGRQIIIMKQDMQCAYKWTMRRVRTTIVPVEKAASITYSECVFVALRSMQRACAVLSSVACLTQQSSSTLSHKKQYFRKEKLMNTKCVFWCYLQCLSETFLIIRRNERDVMIKACWSSGKDPSFLSKFNETVIFSTDFRKTLKY